MSSLTLPRIDQQYGSARIASGGSFVSNSNAGVVQSVLRTGVGVYEITLADGANANECIASIQPIASSSTPKICTTIEWVSNVLIRIRIVGVS